MNDGIGLYIHVPFCTRKCPYCDFYSVEFNEPLADKYTAAVCDTMRRGGILPPAVFDTVYFGGGTPSLLGARRILRILSAIDTTDDAEITIEANPASWTTGITQDLFELYEGGVNRISFGVQSLNDSELKALGRLHTAKDAKRSITDAHTAGFRRISADIMLGIPEQTLESLIISVDELANLPLDHISAYILTPDEDEDKAAEFYLAAVERLKQHGFEQYEISNFAKHGSVSRHNLKYWRCEPYLGIGPAAHSFYDGERFHYPNDLMAFIDAKNPLDLRVADGAGGGFEECAMLRLRLAEGLATDNAQMLDRAKKLEAAGLVQTDGNIIRLTPRGFLFSNTVICEIIPQ